MHRPACDDLHVLVLAPIGQDGSLVCQLLGQNGIAALQCQDPAELARRMSDHDAGAVLITEEAIDNEGRRWLIEALERQSPWLDLPILLCATTSRRGGWPRGIEHLRHLCNIQLLERPVQTAALVSALRMAIRSRRRQLRLKLVADMTASLVAENDPERLLADIWEVLRGHLSVMGYLYHVALADNHHLQLAAHSGITDAAVKRFRELNAEESRQFAETGLDPALCKEAGLRRIQSFPLLAGGERFGVLTFVFDGEEPTPDEVALLGIVCDHLALALRRSQTLSELREHANELAENARRKDEFLAMLGHELRNPLAAVMMGLEVLRQESMIQPAGAEPLEVIREEARHITRLVDDLLDVSRITRGKIELKRKRLDINTLVAEAVEKMQPQAEAKNHRLNLKVFPEALIAEADPTRLRQVVENLVTNAVKYTDPGGTILVSTAKNDSSAEISVRDTGVGLTLDMQSRVFDLFVQDGRALDRSQGGLGIGLTLVQRLVELHGGLVQVFSDGVGHGSEFQVRLPLVGKAEPVPSQDGKAHSQPGVVSESLRVLIVEDLPNVGHLTELLIGHLGHKVKLLQSGNEAYSICRSFRPHLVLLDIGLPDVDGYQVANELRDRLGPECPLLVALTGYGQLEDREAAMDAGFDHHITKPAQLQDFETALKLAAARSGMKQAGD